MKQDGFRIPIANKLICETCIHEDLCKWKDKFKSINNTTLNIEIPIESPIGINTICRRYDIKTVVGVR